MKRYALHGASSLGDLSKVKSLMEEGQMNLDLQDRCGATALHHAVFFNKNKVVETLLQAGVDVDVVDQLGCSPLHTACYVGNLVSTKLLLSRGANVNLQESVNGFTPLFSALRNANLRVVQTLLRAGADLTARDKDGRQIAHLACFLGYEGFAEAVLSKGADAAAVDETWGRNALHWAALGGQTQLVSLLIDVVDAGVARQVDHAGRSVLHLAAAVGNDACVDMLLRRELIDVNLQDNDGCSALMLACASANSGGTDDDDDDRSERTSSCFPATLDSLLEGGASLRLRDKAGLTALQHVARSGHSESLRVVLRWGLDAGKDLLEFAGPALLAAAAFNATESLRILFSAGVDVDVAPEPDRHTALHHACYADNLECAQLLLGKGASRAARGSKGATPLHCAALRGNVELVNVLLNCDEAGELVVMLADDGGSPLHCACFSGSVACISALMDAPNGPSMLARADESGVTPVMLCISSRRLDGVRALLAATEQDERRLLLSAVDQQGNTGLHRAVKTFKGDADAAMLSFLINSGIDVRATNAGGMTALQIALDHNKATAAALLIESGADHQIAVHSPMKAVRDAVQQRIRAQSVANYGEACALFAEKPKKAVQYFRDQNDGDEEGAAESLAQFLMDAPDLDKVQVGELLGEPGPFAATVLRYFLDRLRFEGMTILEALRAYLNTFWLPGEAQRIDRLMQAFSSRYHSDNPGAFHHEDTVYLMAFSLIMLQTDLHSTAIKKEKKMTKEQFLTNNRGIDGGNDMPKEFLSELYDEIITRPLEMQSAQGDVGATPYAMEGMLKKEADSRFRKWVERFFRLQDNCMYYYHETKGGQGPPAGIIPLEDLTVEKTSPLNFVLSCPLLKPGEHLKACKVDKKGVLIPGVRDSYRFETSCAQETDEWVAKIRSNIVGNPLRKLIAERKAQQKRVEAAVSSLNADVASVEEIRWAAALCAEPTGDSSVKGTIISPHALLQVEMINDSSRGTALVLRTRLWKGFRSQNWQAEEADQIVRMSEESRVRRDHYEVAEQSLKALPYRNMARKAFEALIDRFEPGEKITLLGHGISGPLCTILAKAFDDSKQVKVRRVITFGCPAVFSSRGALKHAHLPIIRITHSRDVIPGLFSGYKHCGTEVMLFGDDDTFSLLGKSERNKGTGLSRVIVARCVKLAQKKMKAPVENTSGTLRHTIVRDGSITKCASEYLSVLWKFHTMQYYAKLIAVQRRATPFTSKRNEL